MLFYIYLNAFINLYVFYNIVYAYNNQLCISKIQSFVLIKMRLVLIF